MEVIPAILAVQLSLSKRGGQILHFDGRSYQVTIGKTVLPVEETYSAEELILLSPTLLGKPRWLGSKIGKTKIGKLETKIGKTKT